MKAKIIETGEIVQVVSDSFHMGCVTILHKDNKFSNVHADEIEMIDEWGEKEIDYEQRRYEIAKDVLAGIISNPNRFNNYDVDVEISIVRADELIKQLKSK